MFCVYADTLADRYIIVASKNSLFYPHVMYAFYLALGKLLCNYWEIIAYSLY